MEEMLGNYKYTGFTLRNLNSLGPNRIGLYSPDGIRVAILNKLTATAQSIQALCADWMFKSKGRKRDYGKTRRPYRSRH